MTVACVSAEQAENTVFTKIVIVRAEFAVADAVNVPNS